MSYAPAEAQVPEELPVPRWGWSGPTRGSCSCRAQSSRVWRKRSATATSTPRELPRERLLLEFVGTIARAAYRVTDEQIAEAAYVAALFSLFVRLADTFGIEPPAAYEPTGIPGAITREPAGGLSSPGRSEGGRPARSRPRSSSWSRSRWIARGRARTGPW